MSGCASGDLCTNDSLQNLQDALELCANPLDNEFDVASLSCSKFVGQRRKQIESCWGRPVKNGNYYCYYFLSDSANTLGGGLELCLQYGKGKICTEAFIEYTQ